MAGEPFFLGLRPGDEPHSVETAGRGLVCHAQVYSQLQGSGLS